MASAVYTFMPGDRAVLFSIPHDGLFVPAPIRARFSSAAQALPDTDWHVGRLYDAVHEAGVSVIAATHSRYVIDVNRPPDDKPLYPGATTGLCPAICFDGTPLYQPGSEPDDFEIRNRLTRYWQPYHDRISAELARIKARFGHAVLFDAHSIRSRVPRLFEGRLPDLNVGTNNGHSADVGLIQRIMAIAERDERFSHVRDGRFKGGYITRHYGDPANGIHAVQLELTQCSYMNEDPPFAFRADRAAEIRPILMGIVREIISWSEEQIRATGPDRREE